MAPGKSSSTSSSGNTQRGLGRYAPEARPLAARSARQRQLRAISRTPLELAKRLEG